MFRNVYTVSINVGIRPSDENMVLDLAGICVASKSDVEDAPSDDRMRATSQGL